MRIQFGSREPIARRNVQRSRVWTASLSDAVQTRDLWTFRRDISSSDPNWILIETDEEE